MDNHPHHREFLRSASWKEAEVLAEGHATIATHMSDISLNGIGLACNESLEGGTPCEVRVYLGDREQGPMIRASAHVARSAPELLALEIDSIDLESLEHLRKVVLLNSPDPEQAESEFLAHCGLRAKFGG